MVFKILTLLFIRIILTSNPAYAQEPNRNEGYIEFFESSNFREEWWFANYDRKAEKFNTSWRRRLGRVELPVTPPVTGGGQLVLLLEPTKEEGATPYFGAEAQHGAEHGYGSYEVVMRAGRGSGVVSAFFTYTGPYFKTPHDEVDIEFLGKDTTKIWINRFVDGESLPGKHIDLGFDAAEMPNIYRFDWHPEQIVWYANGKEIYRITDKESKIPSTPGKLFMSIWMGSDWQAEWLGTPEDNIRTSAVFYCVSYRPEGKDGQSCSDIYPADS